MLKAASAEEEVKVGTLRCPVQKHRHSKGLALLVRICELEAARPFLVGRVFQRVTNGKVVSGFETWKDFVLERRKLARFVAKLKHREVYRIWLSWLSFMDAMQDERMHRDEQMRKVIRRLVSSVLSEALSRWKENTWDGIIDALEQLGSFVSVIL